MSCPLPYQDLEPTEVLSVLHNPADHPFPVWELFAVFFGKTGVHCTPGVLHLPQSKPSAPLLPTVPTDHAQSGGVFSFPLPLF